MSPSSTCSPTSCGPAMRRPRAGRSGSCGDCSSACARRSRALGCWCGSMAALPAGRSLTSWKPKDATTWSRWPKTRVWRRAARLMGTARRLSRRRGKTAHVYGQTHYAARRWTHQRRVIIKAEVVRHPGREPKMNPRFVVTNLKVNPRRLYEKIYCARAHIENRIKELHHGLEIDRTSCPRFLANQFRVLLTAAAYVLMQELRRRAAGTGLARAQVSTLRERLLKLGARIERSVRRIVVHLPRTAAYQHEWRRIALAVGA